ncbi:hypothetical protein [Solobacterium sp.]|uniref:hypothetical protein n=1 Tax=Solobacterium sp. TaxID=2060878 RepID=UPI001CAB6E46|nr:hypothetical protein [Solobacterium sp.]MBF1099840.1 hypothetical protein [Solobacterium sp.]
MNDKQFTDELFRRMYDLGYRKAEIENGTVFFYKNCGRISQWSDRVDIRSTCFTEENQRIDIAEYLGIVDWSKVAVDTPILVKQYEQDEWEKRHFAYFKDERVYAWLCGATSWSADYEGDTTDWNLVKLAEV